MNVEVLLDITELSRITSIKVMTLRKFVAHRRIPFVKVGRLVRFRPTEIETWLSTCSVAVEGEEDTSAVDDKNQGLLEL
jgi:excisionase family DNA binding protein